MMIRTPISHITKPKKDVPYRDLHLIISLDVLMKQAGFENKYVTVYAPVMIALGINSLSITISESRDGYERFTADKDALKLMIDAFKAITTDGGKAEINDKDKECRFCSLIFTHPSDIIKLCELLIASSDSIKSVTHGFRGYDKYYTRGIRDEYDSKFDVYYRPALLAYMNIIYVQHCDRLPRLNRIEKLHHIARTQQQLIAKFQGRNQWGLSFDIDSGLISLRCSMVCLDLAKNGQGDKASYFLEQAEAYFATALDQGLDDFELGKYLAYRHALCGDRIEVLDEAHPIIKTVADYFCSEVMKNEAFRLDRVYDLFNEWLCARQISPCFLWIAHRVINELSNNAAFTPDVRFNEIGFDLACACEDFDASVAYARRFNLNAARWLKIGNNLLDRTKSGNSQNSGSRDVSHVAKALPVLLQAYCLDAIDGKIRIYVSDYFKILLAEPFVTEYILGGARLAASAGNTLTLSALIKFLSAHQSKNINSCELEKMITKFLYNEDKDFEKHVRKCNELSRLLAAIIKVSNYQDANKLFSIINSEETKILKPLYNAVQDSGPLHLDEILDKYFSQIPNIIKVYPKLSDFFQKQIAAANLKNVTNCTPRFE